MSINQTEYHADPALSVLLKIAASSWRSCSFWARQKLKWVVVAFHSHRATGTAPAENSRMRHLGTSDQAELRTDIKSAAPAVANSATEVPSEVVDTNNNSFDSNKYQRVCDLRRQMLDNDPTVKFMLEKLDEAGCNFPEDKIVVAECEPGYLGRYLRHELELCHNNFQGDATELKNTIVHELIHAYDECRAKDFDWSNCRHLACSEIRAARLSGDCSMAMELARGRMPLPGYEKACVRRRAELSVKSMPQCRLSALAAVLSNFDDCYNDTDPFARPP